MAKTTVTTAVMQPTSFDQMARIIEPLARREEEYYTTAIQSHTDLMSLSSALSAEDKNSDFYKGTIAPMLSKLSGYADRIAKEGVISDGAYNRAMMQDLVKLKGQYAQGATQLKDALTRRAQYNDMASKARLQDPSAVVLGKDLSIQSFIDDPNKIAPLLFSGEDAKRRAFDYLAAWRNSTQDLKLIGNIDRLTRILRTVKGSSAEDVYKAIGQHFSDPKNPLTELYNQVLHQVKSSYGEDIRKHLDEPEANFALVHGVQRGMIGAAGGDAMTPFEDKEAIMMLQDRLARARESARHNNGGGHRGGNGGAAGSPDMKGGSIDLIARGGGKATYSSGLVGHTLLNSTWRSAVNKFNRLPASSRTPSAMNDLVTEAYAKTFGSQNLPAVSKILRKAGFTWTGNKLVAPTQKSADGKGVSFNPNFLGIQYSADVNNNLYLMTAKNNVAGSFNVSSDVANDILIAALSGAYGDDYKSRLGGTDSKKLDNFVASFRSGTRPKSARVMQDSDGRWYYEAEYINGSAEAPASIAVPLSTSRNLQHLMGLSSEFDFNTSEESLMQKKLFLAKYQSIIENKRANATIYPDQVEAMDIVMDAAQNSPSYLDTASYIFGQNR
jgi:hypothetical protein